MVLSCTQSLLFVPQSRFYIIFRFEAYLHFLTKYIHWLRREHLVPYNFVLKILFAVMCAHLSEKSLCDDLESTD